LFFDQRRGAGQNFVEVQRRVYLLADFGKGSEQFGGNFAARRY